MQSESLIIHCCQHNIINATLNHRPIENISSRRNETAGQPGAPLRGWGSSTANRGTGYNRGDNGGNGYQGRGNGNGYQHRGYRGSSRGGYRRGRGGFNVNRGDYGGAANY